MAGTQLNDISHRRYNPLKDSWVLVSPHRNKKQKRPWQGQKEVIAPNDLPEYDPQCYLCPGNARAEGVHNLRYTGTFVFENDFKAIHPDQGDYDAGHTHKNEHADEDDIAASLLRSQPVTGRCYVLTFSASHHLAFDNMKLQDITRVVEAWTRLYAKFISPDSPLKASITSDLEDDGDQILEGGVSSVITNLRNLHIFENRGALSGCSNMHPHCQIWITSTMPEEPGIELAQMTQYRKEHHGRHLLADYFQLELRRQERIVWQNDTFLVVCPWWAVWPFELLLLPKRHVRALVDLSQPEKQQLAEAMQQVVRTYDSLFGFAFPYNSGIHQAPLDATEAESESSYLHMHFYPPLLRPEVKKFFGGFELMAELLRDLTPEEAAAHLRDGRSRLLANGID